jgi:hypothetical protein
MEIMRRVLSFLSLAAILAVSTTAPVGADDGCARALVATAGTQGHEFVQAHCSSSSPAPESPGSNPTTGAQAALAGCARGLAAAAGTPGEPFVRAACNQLSSQLGEPLPAPLNPANLDNGCVTAELMTRGTQGHAWVMTTCVQTDSVAGEMTPTTTGSDQISDTEQSQDTAD